MEKTISLATATGVSGAAVTLAFPASNSRTSPDFGSTRRRCATASIIADQLAAVPPRIAYAVFEDFQLGDYGNRIPSLSFEIVSDETPVRVGGIVSTLADGKIGDQAATLLEGFAATGDSIRGAAETLAAAVAISLIDDGLTLAVREGAPPALPLPEFALGASADGKPVARVALDHRSALQTPETLSIAHYDPARDYQPGIQSARRDGGVRRAERIDLPATLSASAAKMLAESRLTALWAERMTAKVRLDRRYLSIRPGDRIALPGRIATWRVASAALTGQVVELDLIRAPAGTVAGSADAGRHLAEPDAPHGETRIVLLDLPPLSDNAATAPQVAVAAAGVSAGWRRAALLVSNDEGLTWQEAGQTAAPAIMGTAETFLPSGTTTQIDGVASVEIVLLNAGMQLGDADMPALLRGENLAMIGDELIQFGRAAPLGGNRWRLSQLLRGRRGTEGSVSSHGVGEHFVMIEADSLVLLAQAATGGSVSVLATGIGDTVPAVASRQIVGHAVRPLVPVHGRFERLANGDTLVRWIRRSRAGWAWRDGVDVPLGEETLHFTLGIVAPPLAERVIALDRSEWTYAAAERATDLAAGATSLTLAIRQSGAFGVSLPLTLTILLN